VDIDSWHRILYNTKSPVKINTIKTLNAPCLSIQCVELNWMKNLQSSMNIVVWYTISVVKVVREFLLENPKNTLKYECVNNLMLLYTRGKITKLSYLQFPLPKNV